MRHLGDVSKIHIASADVVDVVIGGSPCQNLSIAGNRKGIMHEAKGDGEATQSGLFMEQVRICREMREIDKASGRTDIDIRPRFFVWENVPVALSSNRGEDFHVVLEEICKIADKGISIPKPGRWTNSGAIVGNGYSVAWRIMDAKYHGVPQRRRRIALVADFGGQSAPKILFDEQGLRWNFEESQKAWQEIAGNAREGAGGSMLCFHCQQDPISDKNVSPCLGGQKQASIGVVYCAAFMGGQGEKARGIGYTEEKAPTLKSSPSGTNATPTVVYAIEGKSIDRSTRQNGKGFCTDCSPTLNTQDRHAVCFDARGNENGQTVCTSTGSCGTVADYNSLLSAGIDCRNFTVSREISGTLQAKESGCHSLNYQNPILYALCRSDLFKQSDVGSTQRRSQSKGTTDLVVSGGCNRKYTIRRLTPLECSRLQGLPDDWCAIPPQTNVAEAELRFWRGVWDAWDEKSGKKRKTNKQIVKWLQSPVSESAQYQLYGNGIALPQWVWVLGRIIEMYAMRAEKPTMASLFDGIGSFPLIWNMLLEGDYTSWASEIQPEAIRVSRYRIGGAKN